MNKPTDIKNAFSLAIIGCGLTGTSMLYQFITTVKRRKEMTGRIPKKIRLIVFEQTRTMGPGLPYSDNQVLSLHISNMPARDMSIVSGHPEDFINWVFSHQAVLKKRYPEFSTLLSSLDFSPSSPLCLPRIIMGDYLTHRFEDALKIAGQEQIEVVIKKGCPVIDILDKKRFFIIKTAGNHPGEETQFISERVFLATGHWFSPAEQKGYFPSPWPAKELMKQIPKGVDVAVIGTSLSAIDAALTLFSDGTFSRDKKGHLTYIPAKDSRHLTLYSRKGYLPKVRGKKGTYQNQFFSLSRFQRLSGSRKGLLTLVDIFNLLKKELEAAYRKPINWNAVLSPGKDHLTRLREDMRLAQYGDNPHGDILWQTVLDQAIPLIKQAYLDLLPSQRQTFEKHFKSVFMTYAGVIPFINSEKILAFMESGVLEIKQLQDAYQFNPLPVVEKFEFCYRNETGKQIRDIYPFVIDARGQSLSYRSNPSLLARNILASGLVQIEPIIPNEISGSTIQIPSSIETGETGSIWIDPDTHRVITKSHGKPISISNKLFSVGIMNRGQILNASMAYECAVSAKAAANYIITDLMSAL